MEDFKKIEIIRQLEKNKLSKMDENEIHEYFARKRIVGKNRAEKLLKRECDEG